MANEKLLYAIYDPDDDQEYLTDQPPNGRNGTPPTNGALPPTNGALPPTNGALPPTNVSNAPPPANGNNAPPPTNGNNAPPPTNGSNGTPPTNGILPPTNGSNGTPPTNGSLPPTNGNNGTPPTNGILPPTNGNNGPPNGEWKTQSIDRWENQVTDEDKPNPFYNNGSNPFDEVFDENAPSASTSANPFTYAEGRDLPPVRHDSAYRRYVGNKDAHDVSDLLERPGFRRYGLESNVIGSKTYGPETGRSKFSSSAYPSSRPSSSSSSAGFAGSRGAESFYKNPNSTAESDSLRQYVRHVNQIGGSVQWLIDPMAGTSDEVVVLQLRETAATFSFRSGQVVQTAVAEFYGALQRNVAAAGFKLIMSPVRQFYEDDRMWRIFMRQVADLTVSGVAFARDVAAIIRVSHRVSRFYVQNLSLDQTDGSFTTVVDAFSYALNAMAVDARGFPDSSFIGALRPIAIRCHRIQTPLQTVVLVVSDFPDYARLHSYVMFAHLIVRQRLTVLVHQNPLNQYIEVLDQLRMLQGDAPQFLLSYQMVHLGSRFAVYQCQRRNVVFNIGFLMPEEEAAS